MDHGDRARLRLRFAQQEIDLSEGSTVIGRGLECEITIQDDKLSRRHAVIHVRNGRAQICDLGSRNGTWLNDRRVQDAPLDHGDFIRLGSQTLLFVMVSAPSRPSAPRVESTSRIEAEGVRSSERLWIAPQLELLESARARGDAAEVQRRLALVVRDVTARVEDGRMDATTLDVLGRDIVRAAVAIGSGATLSWLIDVHRRVGHLPGPSTTTALAACPRILVADAMQAIDRLLESASDQGFSRDLLETLQTKSAR